MRRQSDAYADRHTLADADAERHADRDRDPDADRDRDPDADRERDAHGDGVRDAHGDVVASVSVSGPTFRFGAERVAELVPLLLTVTADVSERLAHQPVNR